MNRNLLVECVPNFSEGRRPEIVGTIRDAIAAVDGVDVLDVSSDSSHNRTVMTFVVPLANCRRPELSPYHVLAGAPGAARA